MTNGTRVHFDWTISLGMLINILVIFVLIIMAWAKVQGSLDYIGQWQAQYTQIQAAMREQLEQEAATQATTTQMLKDMDYRINQLELHVYSITRR